MSLSVDAERRGPTGSGPVLVYDGDCAFCSGTVRRILAADPDGPLRFAPRDGAYGRSVRARHPELAGVESILWVEPAGAGQAEELVWLRSDATLRIAAYLGGAWRLLLLGRLVPRPLRDVVYRFVARHRHRWTGRHACPAPSGLDARRFLDD